ncbi:hypothetical protein G210_2984 [Candida maltosa Xu316]|uniref:F-box domain-containing protein n=1 Tax=Candida maltosa (strain Xu316) TaxID=1245528 RepID=M3HHH7_CANMX|nr:hypothetical protein G210_2984 [Candida maltosa Xu316]
MSGLQLFQLPIEILDIIFSYLSRPDLDKLVEIDYFKSHALRHIYSSVIITGYACPDYLWDESSFPEKLIYPGKLNYPEKDESKPRFFCFKSLTDFVEQNQLPIPKHICFDYFTDIVVAYEKNPKILQDCIIETDLSLSDYFDNPDSTKSYLQKFISLPLKIRSARSCEAVHKMVIESSVQFTRKLTSASFNESFPLVSFFRGDIYQNLVNLEIRDPISNESVKYIPRSVKTLKCEMFRPEFELTEFGFPNGLENLHLSLQDYPEEYALNFSNLEHLVDLKFAIIDEDDVSIRYYKASFPRSLKRVKSPVLDIAEVKKSCPELTLFDCMLVRPPKSNVIVFSFPEKLTHLHVRGSVLKKIQTCENNSKPFHFNLSFKRRKVEQTIKPTSIKFPKNLQSLYLAGDSDFCRDQTEFHEWETLFSDKEENILQKT